MDTPREATNTHHDPHHAGGPAPADHDRDDDRPTHHRGGRIDPSGDADPVQEASEESFPASDPPSFSPRPSTGKPAD